MHSPFPTHSWQALSPMELVGEFTKYAESAGSDVADVLQLAKSEALREKGKRFLQKLNPYWRFKLGEWCVSSFFAFLNRALTWSPTQRVHSSRL